MSIILPLSIRSACSPPMPQYAKYSAVLRTMVKKACRHQQKLALDDNTRAEPITVTEAIDGHVVEAIGTDVRRVGVNGLGRTCCVRWKVNGKWVTTAKLLSQFGELCG